jgi:hypothetical protein
MNMVVPAIMKTDDDSGTVEPRDVIKRQLHGRELDSYILQGFDLFHDETNEVTQEFRKVLLENLENREFDKFVCTIADQMEKVKDGTQAVIKRDEKRVVEGLKNQKGGVEGRNDDRRAGREYWPFYVFMLVVLCFGVSYIQCDLECR